MPKTAATIEDVRALGYQVGIAHGDVQTEQDALNQAHADSHPDVITEQVQDVTATTLGELANAGQLPDNPDDRRALAARIADRALEHLTVAADERVAFHERALQIAKDMPDVWVISGPGVTTVYVACKPDGTGWDTDHQAFLDALADPDAHKERCFQHFAPDEIVSLALEARSLGSTVDGEADDKGWTVKVDGKNVKDVGELEAKVEPLRDSVDTPEPAKP